MYKYASFQEDEHKRSVEVSNEMFILEIEDAQTRKFPSACPHTIQIKIYWQCMLHNIIMNSYMNVDCQEETYCKKYNTVGSGC